MTDKNERTGGNDSGGGAGKKKNRQKGVGDGGGGDNKNQNHGNIGENKKKKNRGGKNTPTPSTADSQSTVSSSKTTSPKNPPPPSASQKPGTNQKVVFLKRDASKQGPPVPLVASVMPLMEVNLSENPPTTAPKHHQNSHQNPMRPYSQHPQTPEKSEKSSGMNTIERRMEANKQQTQAYYFSQNAGVAVSGDKFKEAFQYNLNTFPLERNVNVFIGGKYSLMITPTNNRCNGLFIRVKSQHDDFISTGALLKSDANEETIRKACRETIDRFGIVQSKAPMERYPHSKCSEEYLKSCLIKKLEERFDTFPEAIYYCEKCDYHINTLSHAKAHLESSSHFDDIKRQEQREHLVRQIPKPSKAHLKSIKKLLNDVLDDYKQSLQIQKSGKEKAKNILSYLSDTVFPAINGQNVILKPFGSATYDTILPDSDYNVAYTMDLPENKPIFSLLEDVRKQIIKDGYPADHSIEMGTPSTILFTYEDVRVRLCWMSCFTYRSQLYFTDLMKTYVSLREEVVQFLQLIRLWACKAGVDSKNKPRIGLPRYGFDIMSIHFLQKQGFLPILHEMYEESDIKTAEFDEQSLNSAGGDDISELSTRITPEEAGPRRMRLMSKYEKDLEKIRQKFDLKKSWDQADLFIKFFKYYVEKNRDIVIQITQTEPIGRDVNRWNKKILHVVDPFRGDNVLSIPKVSTWQPFYFNCLLTTYLSFAIPRTKNGPLVEIALIHSKSVTKKKVKEPQTPKRQGDAPHHQNTPISTTPMLNIPEKEYNRAADILAEEDADDQYIKDLKQKLQWDGIKYCQLRHENFEIDDHWQSVYSKKALTRFRRVLPNRLNERIAISLEEHELPNEKAEGWLKRWKKDELGRLEMEEIGPEESKEDKNVAEISKKMEEILGIVESESEEKIASEEEEQPVTVIEKDLVSQQSEIKDESMVMSENAQDEMEKAVEEEEKEEVRAQSGIAPDEDVETSEAVVMCINMVSEAQGREIAADDVKDSDDLISPVAEDVKKAPEVSREVPEFLKPPEASEASESALKASESLKAPEDVKNSECVPKASEPKKKAPKASKFEKKAPETSGPPEDVKNSDDVKDSEFVPKAPEASESEKKAPEATGAPEDVKDSESVSEAPESVPEISESAPKTPEDVKTSDDVKSSESVPDASEALKAPESTLAAPEFIKTSESISTTSESSTLLTTPSKSSSQTTIQKATATFVKTKATPIAEKQICCEEFFIKENVDFKEISVKAKRLQPADFQFEFSSELFCGGYEMEMKCTHCDGSHCVEKCPMMEIPPIVKYEARTPEELKHIDAIIDCYYQENILKDARLRLMEEKKRELERFLQERYQKDVHLTIFGSVMTGLSVNCSDIDICLRFGDGDTPPKDITPKEVIQRTEKALRGCGFVRRVQAIVTAKVPIVKFQLRLLNDEFIDADISYYNILAIYNTALLKEYTLWTPDNRFAKMALYIKRWAKHCDIGDASRGSLSSYAHIILLISYLQNCDPPVLPRLQEDFRSDYVEKRLVENWDTSFAQVEKHKLETWPKNKESCAQLLIGYFDYYSRFDFRNFVVQCRREMILSKMEKEWPRPLCVEDPFDLHHNLSSGITKKMFVFIMKVFINSRAVFMSEKPTVPRDSNFIRNYQDQLLKKCHQGSAPSDRQCHNCHRIGHFYEACPQRTQKDPRRRYGSNSTNSSYRSNENYRNNQRNSEDAASVAGGDRLISHKRVGVKTFHSRK